MKLDVPKQKIYEIYKDYRNEVRAQFRGASLDQRKLAARRRGSNVGSDSAQQELPFDP